MVKMTKVWERTTEFLSAHGGSVFAVAAGLIFLPTLISGSLESASQPATPDSAIAVVFAIIGFAMTIVGAWGGFAITAMAINPSGPGAALGLAGRRLLPLIGITILLLLGMVALMLPFLIIIGVSGIDMAALAVPGAAMPALSPGLVVGFIVYAIVFAALITWIIARLAVLTPVILAERRGLGAISRAWALSRGHSWRIIGVFLLYGIVAAIATVAIGGAAGAVGWIVAGGVSGFSAATLIVAGVAAIVSTLLSVIQNAFLGKLYVTLAPQAELEETFA